MYETSACGSIAWSLCWEESTSLHLIPSHLTFQVTKASESAEKGFWAYKRATTMARGKHNVSWFKISKIDRLTLFKNIFISL